MKPRRFTNDCRGKNPFRIGVDLTQNQGRLSLATNSAIAPWPILGGDILMFNIVIFCKHELFVFSLYRKYIFFLAELHRYSEVCIHNFPILAF